MTYPYFLRFNKTLIFLLPLVPLRYLWVLCLSHISLKHSSIYVIAVLLSHCSFSSGFLGAERWGGSVSVAARGISSPALSPRFAFFISNFLPVNYT